MKSVPNGSIRLFGSTLKLAGLPDEIVKQIRLLVIKISIPGLAKALHRHATGLQLPKKFHKFTNSKLIQFCLLKLVLEQHFDQPVVSPNKSHNTQIERK